MAEAMPEKNDLCLESGDGSSRREVVFQQQEEEEQENAREGLSETQSSFWCGERRKKKTLSACSLSLSPSLFSRFRKSKTKKTLTQHHLDSFSHLVSS